MAKPLEIVFEKDWKMTQAALQNIPRAAPKAMKLALNNSIKVVKDLELKAVTSHYNIKPADVRKSQQKTQKATVKNLVAKQVSKSKSIPLYAFGKPTPKWNQGWKRPAYYSNVIKGSQKLVHGDPKISGTNKGFSAAVYGGVKQGMIPNPKPTSITEFKKRKKAIQGLQKAGAKNVHSGHLGFFVRKIGAGFPPHNQPIVEVMGMGPPAGMLSKRTHNFVQKNTVSVFKKEINRIVFGALTGKIKL
jgi:hypothetical protein